MISNQLNKKIWFKRSVSIFQMPVKAFQKINFDGNIFSKSLEIKLIYYKN